MTSVSDLGIFTAATAQKHGFNSHTLAQAVAAGSLRKLGHGIYSSADMPYDGYAARHLLYKRGIFAKVSALVLYDLTDENPGSYDMAFPHGYNPKSLKEQRVHPFRQSPDRLLVGKTIVASPNGLKIPVYSVERTILDVWEDPKIEPYVRNDALKRYLDSTGPTSRWLLSDLQRKLYPKSTIMSTIGVLTQ